MKRLILTISLIFAITTPLIAQDNISAGTELPRTGIAPYPTKDMALLYGSNATNSLYLRPLNEWERSESSDGIVFTTQFHQPFAWLNRQALLRIENASGAYEVAINGQTVGHTANNFAPTEFNITRYTKEEENTITILLYKEHWSHIMNGTGNNATPHLGQVYILSQPTIRVRDIVHKTELDATGDAANISVGIVVKTESLNAKKARIHYELVSMADTTTVTYGHRDITLQMRGEDTIKFMARIPRQMLWSAQSPTRYRINIMTQIEGRKAEFQSHWVGFRTVHHRDNQLLVNGQAIALAVAVCNPTQAFESEIASARSRGKNAIHFTSPMVPQKAYRLCDSLGMYIVATLPINTSAGGTSRRIGGNQSNNPAWVDAFVERSVAGWHTTCGFASIVAYALGEDSANGIALYESYLRLKDLEHSRPIIYRDAAGEWNNDMDF